MHDWDVLILYPVIPWVYVLEELEASFMIVRHIKTKNMSTTSQDPGRPRYILLNIILFYLYVLILLIHFYIITVIIACLYLSETPKKDVQSIIYINFKLNRSSNILFLLFMRFLQQFKLLSLNDARGETLPSWQWRHFLLLWLLLCTMKLYFKSRIKVWFYFLISCFLDLPCSAWQPKLDFCFSDFTKFWYLPISDMNRYVLNFDMKSDTLYGYHARQMSHRTVEILVAKCEVEYLRPYFLPSVYMPFTHKKYTHINW